MNEKVKAAQESNKVYIRVNKALCTQKESNYPSRPMYNIMKLPKGTKIGETDLSYAIINPIVMFEDKINPNMFCACYDKSKLKDNSVQVYMNIGGERKYMPVDIDSLRDAVAAANHAYYEAHKNKYADEYKSDDTSEVKEVDEKIEPFTTDRLKDHEEEVAAANHAYYEAHKNEHADEYKSDDTSEVKEVDEKIEPLTTDRLKDHEEEELASV